MGKNAAANGVERNECFHNAVTKDSRGPLALLSFCCFMGEITKIYIKYQRSGKGKTVIQTDEYKV